MDLQTSLSTLRVFIRVKKIRMDFLTFVLINGPIATFSIVVNAFFIFCMVCPLNGERIRQPLKLLVWTFICCTITCLMSAIVLSFTESKGVMLYFREVLYVLYKSSMSTNMTSAIWMNFFYYTQIVPAQSALSIWIKKNINSVIYCIWLSERINVVFVMVMQYLTSANYTFDGCSYNFTRYNHTIQLQNESQTQHDIVSYVIQVHVILCLGVMVNSSVCTVVYLCGHMRRMVANGQPVSSPRLRCQVRVTVTGILQGVLYMICTVWTFYETFYYDCAPVFIILCNHLTVFNVYMSGTTVALGVNQAVFRQRAGDIWFTAAQFCRVHQTEQGG